MAERNQDVGESNNASKILIMIIIVLLLIIAGGTAFFMMNNNESADKTMDDEQTEQDSAETAANTAKEFIYYEIEQPMRVNFPKGSSANLIEMKVAFLVDNEASEDAVKKHEPMIVNNLLMAISAVGADQLKTTEGKNELRRRMLQEAGKVMEKMTGKNNVQEIFFTTFVMQ